VIPDILPSKIREMHGLAGPHSVNLGLGQPVVGTPEILERLVRKAVSEDDLGYTSYAGIPDLRRAVARETCGPEGTEAHVSITVGTTEAFFATLLTLLEPGDEVLVPDPGFLLYQAVTRILGGTTVYYPAYAANGFRLQVDDIEARLTDRTKLVVINSPNNPTGQIIPEDALDRLGRLADQHDFYLLSDEVYRTLTYDTTAPSAWGRGDRVLVLNGASKMFAMTGWRLGWIIGRPEVIDRINITHHYMVACAPAIAQRVLQRLYADGGKLAHHLRSGLQAEFAARRELLIAEIRKQLGWEYVEPAGALYLMLRIPDEITASGDSEWVAKDMVREQDVITIPGNAFGSQGEGYLRLSFAVTGETIREGIRRIKNYAEHRIPV